MDYATKKILIVEDEERIAAVITAYLEKEGFKPLVAGNGNDAMEIFNNENIDFVILDLMLPGLPGEEVCKKIRVKSQIPILMMTAKAAESDKIYGLDIGADDYITKPFSPKELVARVKAILRRTAAESLKANILILSDGDLMIDFNKREVKKQGRIVSLTAKEFKLLRILSQNIGTIFSREELVLKVLGYDYEGYDRTIDTHIKNIRQKIEDDNNKYIITIYGLGYKFQQEG